MLRTIFIAWICIATTGCLASISHLDELTVFRESTLKVTNVMVGDSITANVSWTDLLGNTDIANRGVSGDRSKEILKRMDGVLSVNPKKAFLMFGINDFATDMAVDEVYENYLKIVSILQDAHIRIIISSTIKCNSNIIAYGKEKGERMNRQVDELNYRLKAYSDANGIAFIDIDKSLEGPNGLSEKYSNDGVHINLEGYKVWANFLWWIVNGTN